jgi:hypothetical protein
VLEDVDTPGATVTGNNDARPGEGGKDAAESPRPGGKVGISRVAKGTGGDLFRHAPRKQDLLPREPHYDIVRGVACTEVSAGNRLIPAAKGKGIGEALKRDRESARRGDASCQFVG